MTQLLRTFLSLAIALAGLFIMGGWALNQEALKQLNFNLIIMVFNTALCFTVAGTALLLQDTGLRIKKTGQLAAGCFLILFPALIISQDITGIGLGLDQLFVRVAVNDYNLNPGRMAPPTALCFILCGWFLISLCRKRGHIENVVLQAIALIIMALSLIGITTISVRLELLYDWYQYGRMAIPTGMGFFALSGTLWFAWYHQEFKEGFYLDREDKRIGATGVVIISMVALTAGMSGFGLLANQMEQTLEAGLREVHNSNVNLVQNEIESALASAQPLTSRLILSQNLAAFGIDPNSTNAQETIKKDAESFLSSGFSGIAIYALDGKPVTQVGTFISGAPLNIPLMLAQPDTKSSLFWKEDPFLHIATDIVTDGKKIGSVVAERKLPNIATLLLSPDLLGNTAETRICYAINEQTMQCLPSNRHPTLPSEEPRASGNDVTSMDLALRGEAGLRIARDYAKNRVVTVYGPVKNYGLGMVVKVDTAEFYSPLREKLNYAVVLLIILSIIGIVLQRLQLIPLVARLIRSEERNDLAIKGLSVGLWDWNIKTSSLYWSPKFLDILGIKQEDFSPHTDTFLALVHPEDKEKAIHALQNHLQTRMPYDVEYRLRHAEGRYVWIHSTGQAKWNDQGEATRMVGSVIDITDLKKSEQQREQLIAKLTESNTELERFAYVASHDMQEPLRMITNFSSLIEQEYESKLDKEGKEYIKIVSESSKRMQSMIEDLLEYARVGNDGSRFININVMDELRHVLENLDAAIKENSAVITFDNLPNIKGNPVQFTRLLQNLIGNGLKYQAKNVIPQIHIGIEDQISEWRFFVRDNGIGMEQQYANQIFEPFKRLHTWREYKGTGIGLAICKKIIESHNGLIWVTSEPGKGSTFYFTFPKSKPTLF